MSQCRKDIQAAAEDLASHLFSSGKYSDFRWIRVHGRQQAIVVFVVKRTAKWCKELEQTGWFGWPVQIVGWG